jgi:hypothetical protein
LVFDGVRLVQALFPGRPGYCFPPWAPLIPDPFEDDFNTEHKYLMSRADGEVLSDDLRLMGVFADLIRELAKEVDRVGEDMRALLHLRSEVGIWRTLVPRCIAKSPVSAEDMAMVEKWKSSSGLGDCREHRELVFQVQKALSDVERRLDL